MDAQGTRSGKGDRRRQYAALPWRVGAAGPEILLVTSRRTRRWIVPKGWPMKNRSAAEAAAQEAWEEAGVRGVTDDRPVGLFHYLKHYDAAPERRCRVTVFALRVDEVADDWPERGQRERRWMSASEAAAAVEEAELKQLIARFAAATTQAP